MATMNVQSIVAVKVTSSDGIIGIGEGTMIGGLSCGNESPEGVRLSINQYIAPVLRGRDASRVVAAMAQVGRWVVGNHFAKSAIETAQLDAMSKRVGLPRSGHQGLGPALPPLSVRDGNR